MKPLDNVTIVATKYAFIFMLVKIKEKVGWATNVGNRIIAQPTK